MLLAMTISNAPSLVSPVHAEIAFPTMRFSFVPAAAPEFTVVEPTAVYSDVRGFGFDKGRTPETNSVLFSVKVPEGNYLVTVWLGSPDADSETTIKAETRRLVIPATPVKRGQTVEKQFAVNVRNSEISPGVSVRLNDREKIPSLRHWDDKLSLEFLGKPAVQRVEIKKADDLPTLFMAGDSTMTDQAGEPWIGWGQMMPQFFTPGIAVANHGESGRALRSFRGDRRWDKILSQLKPGDYVMIQFGHNDMKEKGEGVGAFTTYAASLKECIADVRKREATPIVITPMERRRFDKDGKREDTHGDYPDAVRKVAEEEKVALIDLNKMSKPLYEAFGVEPSKKLFVFFPANTYPGQNNDLKDNTHFQAFGGDQIARCAIQSLRDANHPLTKYIREDVPAFDPSKPGDPSKYVLAPSQAGAIEVPEGR
ncbi:MAG: rhamnogalacturonan acetylesterase [Burkholderiales bacterium]|nr:rhamnogalacturonan acetylesterase [Phycisphaerae bacterium]